MCIVKLMGWVSSLRADPSFCMSSSQSYVFFRYTHDSSSHSLMPNCCLEGFLVCRSEQDFHGRVLCNNGVGLLLRAISISCGLAHVRVHDSYSTMMTCLPVHIICAKPIVYNIRVFAVTWRYVSSYHSELFLHMMSMIMHIQHLLYVGRLCLTRLLCRLGVEVSCTVALVFWWSA